MQTPIDLRLGLDRTNLWTESEMLSCRGFLKKNARSMLGKHLRMQVGSSDLVQETLMVTVMNLSAMIGRPKRAVFHWMVSVMRHRILKHARDEKLIQEKLNRIARSEAVELVDPDRKLIDAELKGMILEKLQELESLSRRMFELRYFEGYELDQIAAETGRSKSAVRGNLYRTLGKIRDQLKDDIS